MPAFTNLIFFTAVGGAAYLLFLAVWLILLRAFRLDRRWHTLLSVPAFLLIAIPLCFYRPAPSSIFEDVLGFAPPPDVTSIRSSRYAFGGTGVVYLRFQASPATVDRIAARGLVRALSDLEADFVPADPSAPDWWQPATVETPEVYRGSFPGRGYASVEEYLIYDRTSGEAYFRFVGID